MRDETEVLEVRLRALKWEDGLVRYAVWVFYLYVLITLGMLAVVNRFQCRPTCMYLPQTQHK